MTHASFVRFLATSLVMLAPVVAQAQAPEFIPVQGSLFDEAGEPINETLPVAFTLYADAAGTTPVFSETAFVVFEGGYFTEYLGPVDLSRFAERSSLFLGINVNGDGEMELVSLATVPFAAWADFCGEANTLDGQTVADIQQSTIDALGPLSNDNPYRHNRYTDAEARAAMGPIANENPYAHNRYTDAEARTAMGPIANDNPYAHNRYTDAEARTAMGPIANDNPYAHNRYTDGEARAAMGPIANDNPYAHNRYTDDEARAAVSGLYSSTTHDHGQGTCAWQDWGCGQRVCPANTFMAGMETWPGAAEQCNGGGDFDEPFRRIYCCSLADPRN